ncbi:MAG: hypothetical protein QM680_04430 [Luteolibacter sp.]
MTLYKILAIVATASIAVIALLCLLIILLLHTCAKAADEGIREGQEHSKRVTEQLDGSLRRFEGQLNKIRPQLDVPPQQSKDYY